MSVGENISRYRKSRGMTQAQLAEAVGLTEGAVRHYESGIRAVKPELIESIAAALGVSVNALKDYGVETAGDLMSLLVRLEDSFGIVPAADGSGTARSMPGNTRTGKPRCSGSPHFAINAQPNQDARLGGERRPHLRMLSFYSPLHAKAFSTHLESK